MSVKSDVHETCNEVIGDYAITRFKFYHGNLYHKRKKMVHETGTQIVKTLGENTYTCSKQRTDCFDEFDNSVETVSVTERLKETPTSTNCVIDMETDKVKTAVLGQLKDEADIDNDRTKTFDDFHEYDSDGDMQLRRKRCNSSSSSEDEHNCNGCLYITIKHRLETELESVGEQVWQGALLLCDYICYQRSKFKGHCVVDLGAGTGLSSIVAAMFADHVFCTDTGEKVLQLASYNIDNAVEYFQYDQSLCPIDIKELDWLADLSDCKHFASQFALTCADLKAIKESDIFIAADVFYDDDITDAFFSTIKNLMSEPPDKTLYISLERRLVFTIADLAVTNPAYDHFKDHLNQLVENNSASSVKFTVEKLDTDFPQCFQYNRTDYMELWTIKSTLENT